MADRVREADAVQCRGHAPFCSSSFLSFEPLLERIILTLSCVSLPDRLPASWTMSSSGLASDELVSSRTPWRARKEGRSCSRSTAYGSFAEVRSLDSLDKGGKTQELTHSLLPFDQGSNWIPADNFLTE